MKAHRIILALAIASLMTACHISFDGSDTIDFTYDHPERYSAGDATIAQPVQSVVLDWLSGAIDVSYADHGHMRIREEADTALSDSLRMHHYVDEDGCLHVKFCKRGKYTAASLNDLGKRLYVEVPRGTSVEGLEINAVNADVRIDSVLSRKLEINTVNGTFDATYPTLPDDIELNAVNTDATLHVLPSAGITIGMSAVNSGLNSDLPARKVGKKTVIGDGSCDMEVNAVNGTLSVKELKQ